MIDKPSDIGTLAERLGVPTEKIAPFCQSLTNRFGQGDDQMAALIAAAQEHDVPVEKLKEAFRDVGRDDFENPAEDLAELLAKGLFGDGR